jgi:CPA1 family monovalent cation:H+ antiporter
MEYGLKPIISVLAIAMIVAIAARRFRLPYTVGLVVVGAVLALSKADLGISLTRDFIFNLILPPLLFEAALTLSGSALLVDLAPIVVLSVFGTIVAAAVVASGMTWLLGWPWASALVFGALIAATDPVAVIAMFKDNAVKGRLRLLVESESLFNDGVAAVLFVMALAWAQSPENTRIDLETAGVLARIVFGGVAVGAICAGASIMVAWRTSEHLIEAALTTVTAFGSFFLAEQLHLSGVLATVTAGLVMGDLGMSREEKKSFLSSRGREFILGFWDFAAFLANSVIFLLIGATVETMPFHSYGIAVLLTAVVVTLLARALTVYPLSLLFLRSRWSISLREQHILWWGGLRGALALALALSLPTTLPLRDEIVVVTFGVVAFSVVVQGLTMPLMLRRLGFLSR